jgi:hypothetical protein
LAISSGCIVVVLIAVTWYPAACFDALVGSIAVGDIFMIVTVSLLNGSHSEDVGNAALMCLDTSWKDTLDEEVVLHGVAVSSSNV